MGDRLIRVEDGSGGVIAAYGYDPFGRRLWKEVGGVLTYFAYAEEGLIGEYDATGAEIRAYGYEPDSLWTTNPLYQKVGGQYYWYLNDHAGTPQKFTDAAGRVVWSAVYEAFGRAQVRVADVENNLRLPGQYYDAETGLHYNWFRSYDPATGRYLRLDPLAEGLNHYTYALGNPIGLVDPEGLHVLQIGMGLAQIFAGFSATAATGGAGVVVGWIAVTNGLNNNNNIIGGLGSLITGTPQQTPIQWGVQRLTGSQTAANWVQFALNLVYPAKAPQNGLMTPRKFFRGKTYSQAKRNLRKKFGPPRSSRPSAETFYNPTTGRSYNVHTDPAHGPPHVDIRTRGPVPDRKLPLRGGN